jgi:hypothetical protein
MLFLKPGETVNSRADGLLIGLSGNGTVAGQPFSQGEVWHINDSGGELQIASSNGARLLRVTCPGA